ncbi:MAG: hypothetical protein MUD12_14620 [Spirochaetes bacterium]|nr:hypothetical protein [Spirochaetota bacterium]
MILITLFLLLVLSFSFHIMFLAKYVYKREGKYLRNFINSAVLNVLLALSLIIVSLYKPDQIQEINIKLLLWMVSGMVLGLTLFIKISILHRIYRRAKDPDNYHFNYFGKKVLHSKVATPIEIGIFFVTMPFFCFAGAYFVARLLNLYLYRHL